MTQRKEGTQTSTLIEDTTNTFCLISHDPYVTANYYIQWVLTSWTYSMTKLFHKNQENCNLTFKISLKNELPAASNNLELKTILLCKLIHTKSYYMTKTSCIFFFYSDSSYYNYNKLEESANLINCKHEFLPTHSVQKQVKAFTEILHV